MNYIIEAIDREIAHLQQVRALLSHSHSAKLSGALEPLPTVRRRGRPAGSKTPSKQPKNKPRRILSPEGKAKIVEGQRKRWAAAKKAA